MTPENGSPNENVLCVAVCVYWSHDEERLIRTCRRRRRRCRVNPKGEGSIDRDGYPSPDIQQQHHAVTCCR